MFAVLVFVVAVVLLVVVVIVNVIIFGRRLAIWSSSP